MQASKTADAPEKDAFKLKARTRFLPEKKPKTYKMKPETYEMESGNGRKTKRE